MTTIETSSAFLCRPSKKTACLAILVTVASGCGGSGYGGAAPPPNSPPSANEPPPKAAAETSAAECRLAQNYEPRRPHAGDPADLPPVPNLPKSPIRIGAAYTAWGASYHRRSLPHRDEVEGKQLSITGYIVKTNLPDAPACAVHAGGIADPDDCRPPIPAFWIGDSLDTPVSDAIKVMGWASNYAQIYDAIETFDRDPDEEHLDTFWGVNLPNPLPAAGAKVTVTGTYAHTFTMASAGVEADPVMGLLTAHEIETLEPAPTKATLPGVRRK